MSASLDQQIKATGIAWAHPIDESAGLRWDSYNARWQVKLLGRDAWVLEAGMDYSLAWAIKAMREHRLREFLRRVIGPPDAIQELIQNADLYVTAEQSA